ncbi:MAG: hypothetical protein AB7P02_23940 [Alphaproteobacteria bacterium]
MPNAQHPTPATDPTLASKLTPEQKAGRDKIDEIIDRHTEAWAGKVALARGALFGHTEEQQTAEAGALQEIINSFARDGAYGAWVAASNVRDPIVSISGEGEIVSVDEAPTLDEIARGIAIGTAYADHGTRGGIEPLLDHADLIAPTIAAYMRDGRVGVGTLFMAGADEPTAGADSPIAA